MATPPPPADPGADRIGRRDWVRRLGWVGAVGGLVAAGDVVAGELAAGDTTVTRTAVFIDDHGADPTGHTASDGAWRSAYRAALARVERTRDGIVAGVSVVFGPGIYRFSVGTVVVRHPQIGLLGQGRGVTVLRITGAGGDGLWLSNRPHDPIIDQAAAAVGGFTLDGWSTGSAVNGFHFGDRPLSRLDLEVIGFRGSGSRNLLFRNDLNTSPGSEGTVAQISTAFGGAALVSFDGNPDRGSFDYSDWAFHVISGELDQDHAVCEFVNGAHANGARLTLAGNVSSSADHGSVVLQIGRGGDDLALLNRTELRVAVENDGGGGALTDLNIDVGGGASAGLDGCHGQFTVVAVDGTTVAGQITPNALANLTGLLDAPVFGQGSSSRFGNLTAWRVH